MKRCHKICEMCDHASEQISARDWCLTCEAEFEEIRTRRFHGCQSCPTPITCAMTRRCMSTDPDPVQLLLFHHDQ